MTSILGDLLKAAISYFTGVFKIVTHPQLTGTQKFVVFLRFTGEFLIKLIIFSIIASIFATLLYALLSAFL